MKTKNRVMFKCLTNFIYRRTGKEIIFIRYKPYDVTNKQLVRINGVFYKKRI